MQQKLDAVVAARFDHLERLAAETAARAEGLSLSAFVRRVVVAFIVAKAPMKRRSAALLKT